MSIQAPVGDPTPSNAEPPYKSWLCVICGLIYNESEGWPADGILPGTRWDEVPEDWVCPDCGTGKSDFEMIEI